MKFANHAILALVLFNLLAPCCAKKDTKSKSGKSDKSGKKGKKGKKMNRPAARWTIDDIISSDTPYLIGHRGFGATDGTGANIPGLPTENTIDSAIAAFEAGAPIVEVDVQLTGEGELLLHHDDFLPDFSCINQLEKKELEAALPEAPYLNQFLRRVKKYSDDKGKTNSPSGLLLIEIKAPSPLCDPFDDTEEALVNSVIDDIYKAGMAHQVIIQSFSPALLKIARYNAPEIDRALLMSVIQFLSPEIVEQITGLTVTSVDKDIGLGLQWANTGDVFLLPGYASIEEFITTAVAVGVTTVSVDLIFLAQAEQATTGSGSALVSSLQSLGLIVYGFTARSNDEWCLLDRLGVDGIVTDMVEEHIALQCI